MRLDYIDNIDCLEGLQDVPDKSVDLVITDPPYFINMGHAGDKKNAKRAGLDHNRTFNDLAIAKPFYMQLFKEFGRVLKDDGSFYIFTDWRGYAFYYPICVAAGLPVRNMIVWDKKSGPGSYYSFAHELIIFGTYANKLRNPGGTNVWREKSFSSGAKATNGEKVHPTQKPVELIEKAILDSTEPGAIVLDTFMGSGTTAVACVHTGRKYIGFEIDEGYHALAVERVGAEKGANTVQLEAPGPDLLKAVLQGFSAGKDPEAGEDWLE